MSKARIKSPKSSQSNTKDTEKSPATSKKGKEPQPNTSLWFKKAPRLSDELKRRPNIHLEAKLFDLLEGKKPVAHRAVPPGVGTSIRGLGPGQEHYLPNNRLLWWKTYFDVTAPGGEVELLTDPIRDIERFPCEFSPAVGKFVTWESVAPGSNANQLPDAEFTMRSSDPNYQLVVIDKSLQGANERGEGRPNANLKVVLHQRPQGVQPDPNTKLPSTFIIFDEPQRSVAISFGFNGQQGQTIPAANCRLIAYDIDGRILATASGGILLGSRPTRTEIPNGTSYNLLGVTDRNASIAYVEFEFDKDHADDQTGEEPYITAEQIIQRVWHEPFPSVAVLQDFIEIENSSGRGLSTTSKKINLPFHCNQVFATLRGFHAEFVGDPQELKLLNMSVGAANGSLIARGMMNATKATKWRMRLYYSLVAWNDRTVNLETSGVFGQKSQSQSGDIVLSGIHPCQQNTDCPIAGTLTHLSISPSEEEIDDIFMNVKAARMSGRDPYGTARVEWPIDITLDPRGARSAHGLVLGSPSLKPGKLINLSQFELRAATTSEPEESFFDVTQGGRLITFESQPRIWNRVGQDYETIIDENRRTLDFAVPVAADMAFVSIGAISSSPEGKIRQLSAELIGSLYDGQKMQFKMAGGIATEKESDSEDDLHFWSAFPQVIGLSKRVTETLTNRIRTQNIEFGNTVQNVVTLTPQQFGALVNDGQSALRITGARLIGSNAQDFSLVVGTMPSGPYRQSSFFENLRTNGLTFHILDIANRNVALRQGETLLIGGACLPSGGGTRSAILELTTNDRLHPVVQIEVSAQVAPSQADGIVLPERIDFGSLAIGQSRTRYGLVASIGYSALLVTDVQISGNSNEFSFAMPGEHFESGTPDQVEPGDVWPNGRIHITFTPQQAGERVSKLIVTTNDGELEVALQGLGV
ncbi:MAG: hypothetical protein KF836_10840 [Fimbriimonadaceae bacterium]|nr:hypothetical protein [Fimbriimonadaceae bacterium]